MPAQTAQINFAALEKKSLHASERDTPRVRALRGWWWRRARDTDPAAFVFVDESGANTAMARLYGRAPPGERGCGAVPHRAWKTLTLLGAVRLDGVAAGFTVDAATDADVFRAFVV